MFGRIILAAGMAACLTLTTTDVCAQPTDLSISTVDRGSAPPEKLSYMKLYQLHLQHQAEIDGLRAINELQQDRLIRLELTVSAMREWIYDATEIVQQQTGITLPPLIILDPDNPDVDPPVIDPPVVDPPVVDPPVVDPPNIGDPDDIVIDQTDWPFTVAVAEKPNLPENADSPDYPLVEVFTGAQLQDALASGTKHIVIKFSPITAWSDSNRNGIKSWLFNAGSQNHDTILDLTQHPSPVVVQLDFEIKPEASRFEIRGGHWRKIKGRSPGGQDIRVIGATFTMTGNDQNTIHTFGGNRWLFYGCEITSDEYAWYNESAAQFTNLIIYDCIIRSTSGIESIWRFYNGRLIAIVMSTVDQALDAASPPNSIKAAIRFMDSDKVLVSKCDVRSHIWVNMPPGPGRTGDNGSVYIWDTTINNVRANGKPIEAWGTGLLDVRRCTITSQHFGVSNWISKASDVRQFVSVGNTINGAAIPSQ
jgi:hypothetical protein